jgi:endoglucanase Acf2
MENTIYPSSGKPPGKWRSCAAALLASLGLLTTAPENVLAQTITRGRPVRPQTVVPLGAASYASEPPYPADVKVDAKDGKPAYTFPDTARYDFYYRSPIYISRAAKQNHTPVPTNDWWTDLLINGKNAGSLWVYPLVLDPDPNGFNLNFPNTIDVDNPDANGRQGGYNMHYGGNLRITAAGYKPSTALAQSWTDWGLVMSMPDTTSDPLNVKNMQVTTAHGVPFAWVETQGVNPQLGFEKPATFLDASGAPLQFPARHSFVISTDNRYFGVHLAPGSVMQRDTAHFAIIDLGQKYPLSDVKLYWEAAYARDYSVQVSDDGLSWTTAYSTTSYTRPTNVADINLIGKGYAGRYVKLVMTHRAPNNKYGYSLFEMEVYDGNNVLRSQKRPVTVSSVENGSLEAVNLVDGNLTTRWSANYVQNPVVVMQTGAGNTYFVVSALQASSDQEAGARLATYEAYAYNKVSDTKVTYAYDVTAGKVNLTWNLTTTNLKGLPAGSTLQGFLPHLYENTAHAVAFSPYSYVSPRGSLKTAVGTSFAFTYDFNGIIPSYNAPFRNASDAHPYDAQKQFDLVTAYAAKPSNGSETYYGAKDLVQHMKFALLAKELNHQAYPALKEKARAALVDWLTYTPGETPARYFAPHNRWGAFIGYTPNFNSDEFTDNHFHYGYYTLACALYNMLDPNFLSDSQYGPIARKIAKQYANWDRNDPQFPWMRTFDPWVGHSYAGGTSSGSGNNQESSSESMQSWIGLFLLGDALHDPEMRAAGAFGYTSEAAASLEYWFDWKHRNFPPAFRAVRRMGTVLSNQGLGHVTYFGDVEHFVHGIEYLPLNPGVNYLARDTTWAQSEYRDLLTEARAEPSTDANTGVVTHYNDELDFGDDWTHVALGLKYMIDPKYTTGLMENNYKLAPSDKRYIMDAKEVAGMTYFYAHAQQNLGFFSSKFHTNLPASNVFERNGKFTYATAYNATDSPQTATVYDTQGNVVRDAQGNVASALIPAHTLKTFPTPPTTGQAPTGCYNLLAANTVASSSKNQPDSGSLATDGDPGSRWESDFTDPQQLTVDYGSVSPINTVTIAWENASAKTYQLLGSTDGTTWTLIKEMGSFNPLPAGQTRTDVIPVNGSYRYLRMAGTSRTTPYGYSIYEFTACGTAAPTPTPVSCYNLLAASTVASSSQNQPDSGPLATDGNPGSRWESKFADPQQLTVDYGSVSPINTMTIAWENASANTYQLLGSTDGTTWTTIQALGPFPTLPAGQNRTDVIPVNGSYRYLRMAGTSRTTQYGYSIYEFTACSSAAPASTPTESAPAGCHNLLAASVVGSSSQTQPDSSPLATDGKLGSRWESKFADPQQLTVDYGSVSAINTVTIAWENASARTYQLQGSIDGSTWTTIKAMGPFAASPTGQGRTDVIPVNGSYRYLRMAGTSRTTPYGYSIYEFTACSSAASMPGPLPVTLLDFSAQAQTAAVGLTWHTASERNSARFEVQRSLDGSSFTTLGRVAARGTSTKVTDYTHRDAALPAGASQLYYRLRKVDLDGKATYSPVRTVSLPNASKLALYPNPAHTAATLTGATPNSAVYLLDALGRTVATATADETGKATILLPIGLPSGVYLVRTGTQALRLLVR